MYVPEYGELKRDIMEEAHSSAYAMHPSSTKMYKTLKENLLVEWDEERNREFRFHVPNLSAGEGRASEAREEDTATPYSSLEMGEDHYGFCNRSSMDSEAA